MKIYTKTGDKGQTGLFSGRRVSKDDARVEAYGTVDELNAQLGLLRDLIATGEAFDFLLDHQKYLFTLGGMLADDREDSTTTLPTETVNGLEAAIDRMNESLPPLRHFILPGGHPTVSQTHVCRTVCRRAERRVVTLSGLAKVDPGTIVYLNRLSDYFFVLGRQLAREMGVEAVKWVP